MFIWTLAHLLTTLQNMNQQNLLHLRLCLVAKPFFLLILMLVHIKGHAMKLKLPYFLRKQKFSRKESQHKPLLEEVQKNIFFSAQKKQKEQYNKKHRKAVFYSIGTKVLIKDFRKKKRKGGKLDLMWIGPYLITKSLGKGFYELQSCGHGKGPVTTIQELAMFILKCTSHCPVHLQEKFNTISLQ